MEFLKEISHKFCQIIAVNPLAIGLLNCAVVLVIWALEIHQYLSPTSQYNLSKYYRKKRPDVLTLEVLCPSKDPQNPNCLTIMEEHSFQHYKRTCKLIRFPILCFNHKVISRALAGRLLSELLDIEGKKLTDFYQLGNIPSKFNTLELFGNSS